MLLLVTTKVGTPINWWFKPIGCEMEKPTREQLLHWHTEKPRKITEGVNPLIITGLVELGAAIGLEFISDSKNIRLLSILLGIKGVILNILGGTHAYDLVSEAKNKKLTDSTNTTKGNIAPIHNSQETNNETSTEGPIKLKIHSGKSLSGDQIKGLIENGEIAEDVDDKTPIKQSLKDLRLLEEKFDTEKILNTIKRILNKCRQKQYKNISKEAYEEVFELGRKVQVKVLAKAFEENDIRLKRWAILCLISKENSFEIKEAEQVLVNALKEPENMAIMLSISSNENLQELAPTIAELLKKSAA